MKLRNANVNVARLQHELDSAQAKVAAANVREQCLKWECDDLGAIDRLIREDSRSDPTP